MYREPSSNSKAKDQSTSNKLTKPLGTQIRRNAFICVFSSLFIAITALFDIFEGLSGE
jgi:hypothetical protein